MSKRILQDVVASSGVRKKSAVHSRVSAENKKRRSSIDVRMPSSSNEREYKNTPAGGGYGKGSRFAIWGVAAGSVVFLLFVLLSFFSGTVVKVTPLEESVTVSGTFYAQKNAGEGALPFKLIVLEDSLSGEAATSEEKEVERKASGRIVVYNTYSSKSQKLIKRTRFETPDGKIYRINKSIIVPGTTVKNGKIVPGSVETEVFADIPGEEYNIGLTDFTIPGFKGDLRFDKFYARSKTPMEDGFSGTVKVASPEDITKTEKELSNSLKETLLQQARSNTPEDFILYDDAVFFSFGNDNNLTYSTKDTVDVLEKGTLYGILFNKSELSKYIAVNTVADYDGSDVVAQGLENLKFKVRDREKFNPAEDTSISFTAPGQVTIVWKIDKTKISRDLAGTNKADFLNIINKNYPNIQHAKATIRPFWEKIFPKNSDEITIKEINTVDGR
jgi:hypothetical protein